MAAMSVHAVPVVALCAGSATWLAMKREPGVRRARVLFVEDPLRSRRQCLVRVRLCQFWRRGTETALRRREWWCVPAALLLAVMGGSVLPLVAGAVAVPLVGRWLRRRAGARDAERGAAAVAALCGTVVGELRAGREPGQALLAALSEGSGEADDSTDGVAPGGRLGAAEDAVLAAARFGGDVPAALRQAAQGPGLGGLSGMAACWRVAVDGGAGLAAGLERLEATLRDERRRREELRAQLAGAWSTVVVLALLPGAGLGLGASLGAEPLRVLLHTPAGLACLTVGASLEAAGLYWACRIVRGGEAT
ncbi:type II secretion system F family protein [Streptomyces californicus]|uniref:type II secretion system F family protein n=1 Tax=Streptomyces californicus TaxID=67351 RepID=UPI0036A1157C